MIKSVSRRQCVAPTVCHASEGWHPGIHRKAWMPAFAGMTLQNDTALTLQNDTALLRLHPRDRHI